MDTTVVSLKFWIEDSTVNTFHALDSIMDLGPGSMPIFDTLTTEARQKIYDYIKTFK